MSQRTTAFPRRNLLPPGAAAFARRRAVEACGAGVAVLAAVLAAALASYDPADPSWNHATDAAATNLIGRPGAHVADFMLQTLGVASFLVVVVLAAWAWRLMSHRGVRWFWLRLAVVPAALMLGAAAWAAAPVPAEWPLETGLGGWLGDYLFGQATGLAQGLGLGAGPPVVVPVSGLAALAALAFAMGIAATEWAAIARAGAWLPIGAYRALRFLGNPAGGLARRRRSEPGDERAPAKPGGGARPVKTPRPARRESPGPRVERGGPRLRTGKRASAEIQPALDLEPSDEYRLPPLSLLNRPRGGGRTEVVDEEALEQNARLLESVLDDFGVRGDIVRVRPGPVVTLYELEPAPGTKSSRVIGLADDIARSMSAVSARVAVIPGRNAIGIELPNDRREVVYLRELLSTPEYENTAAALTLALGKDIGGAPVIADITRMPHLLVAGTTGSGKSVAINAMILSLLYRLPPDRCRLIMIDPKMLELSVYDGIPHLLCPVVTDPGKAIVALKWTVREMEERYRKMSELGVRNVDGYNSRLALARERGETLSRTVQTGFDPETGQPVLEDRPLDLAPMPLIVVIVDEMADLMLVAGKDVEAALQRLSQMARAAGIHLIMATQRPSVDVITGTIKANFPTRVSFQVTSKIDSRTILGEQGAEQLLGSGDMLYMAGAGRITRVHGPYVGEDEVERVVTFLKRQATPDYNDAVTEDPEPGAADFSGLGVAGNGNGDGGLYDQAVALVCRERRASTSFVQRHLQIGYNRAARLIERMEAEGVIGPANHVGKREVLARDIDDRST